MKDEVAQCPYCKYPVVINITWAIKNGLVFCGTCCKAFPVRIGEDTKEKPVEEKKKEDIEEKWDKGVKEILEDEDNYSYWDDGF